MTRRLIKTLPFAFVLGLLAVTSCHAKSLSDGDEKLPEPAIEHLGDCENEPSIKKSCEEVCGENSCRNRLSEKSLLPVQHFCFCHENLPEESDSFPCMADTDNSTLENECQRTCANLVDPEGNQYADFYCSSQVQDQDDKEECVCVPSTAIPEYEDDDEDQDQDSENALQNPRAGTGGRKCKQGNRKCKRPNPNGNGNGNNYPTNGASCTNVDGGSQSALSCQAGDCFAICPDSQLGSSIPPGSNGNNDYNSGSGGSSGPGFLNNNNFVVMP